MSTYGGGGGFLGGGGGGAGRGRGAGGGPPAGARPAPLPGKGPGQGLGRGSPQGAPLGRGLPPGQGQGGDPRQAAGQASGGIPYVTEREFEQEVLRSELPVLLYFTAEWCQPCKTIGPEVEAFAREMQGKVKAVKIDVDRAPVIAQQLRIQSVPTFMVFAEGRIADSVVGAVRKKKLHEMVEPFLPRAAGALKPKEVSQLVAAGAVVPIDTRDAAAYGRAHLPGAKHMPMEEIETRLAELHMLNGQPVVYCRAGDKTRELADRLAEQGLPVAFLEGGLLAWEAEGLPIERP